jgi:hypothetical protein
VNAQHWRGAIGYESRVLRVLWLVLLIACSKDVTEAGRVEIDRSGKTVVVRDSGKAIEIDFASTKDHAFEPFDLPVIEFPGRLAIQDAKRNRALLFWITKLGDKRPANIQRWFEGKIERIKPQAVISDRVVAFQEHPGRVVDYSSVGSTKTQQRLIAVDLPEHDLVFVMLAIVDVGFGLKPEDQAWLDAVVADVQTMRITPR